MLNLWGYADVLTCIAHHPVAYIVLNVLWNLIWLVIVGLFKAFNA